MISAIFISFESPAGAAASELAAALVVSAGAAADSAGLELLQPARADTARAMQLSIAINFFFIKRILLLVFILNRGEIPAV